MKYQHQLKPGDRVQWKNGVVRVMAVAEGYVMVRYRGCMAFCVYEKDLLAYSAEQKKVLLAYSKEGVQKNHET